jgi:hypothetical protein
MGITDQQPFCITKARNLNVINKDGQEVEVSPWAGAYSRMGSLMTSGSLTYWLVSLHKSLIPGVYLIRIFS